MSSSNFSHLLAQPSKIPQTYIPGEFGYGATRGTSKLINAIRDYEHARCALIDFSANNILVTHGATQATSIIFDWHKTTGGRIFLPTPGYPAYVHQCHGMCKRYENSDLFNSLKIFEQLKQEDLLVINSPHNPTGSIIEARHLIDIVHKARAKGIFICFDNVYGELSTATQTLSIRYNPNLFFLNSVSKIFDPNLRVGWIVTASPYLNLLVDRAEAQSIAVSSENQVKAAVFLESRFTLGEVERIRKIRENIASTVSLLGLLPGNHQTLDVGPFALFSLPDGISSEELNCYLKRYDSHVLPGSIFGASEGCFRLPLGMNEQESKTSVELLSLVINEILNDKFRIGLSKYFEVHKRTMISFAESGLAAMLETNQTAVIYESSNESTLLFELQKLGWIIPVNSSEYKLSDFGRANIAYVYYYWLLEGGYSEVLSRNDSALRNMTVVGQASCQMSKYGAFLLIRKFLDMLPFSPSILDIGCGSGEGSILFVQMNPSVNAIGIEPTEELVELAKINAANKGYSDRIKFKCGNALDSLEVLNDIELSQNIVPVFSFVLHEMVGQIGEDRVIAYLENLRAMLPNSPIVVIEPDLVDRAQFGGFAGEFYDFYWTKYYAIHHVTNQKLLAKEEWERLFAKAGYHVVAQEPIPAAIDPCKIEIGFLLKPNE